MPTFSLDDLTTPMTRADVEAKIYQVLGTIGVSTTSWKSGAVVRTMITACAIVMAAFSTLQALIAKSGFLELAQGAWLAIVAKRVYNVDKDYAEFAAGDYTLTNNGGGVFDEGIGDLIVANPTTGKQYRNSAAFHLDAMGTITVPIIAVEAGAASTSSPNTITQIVSPSMTGVTGTNANPLVGADDETDPNLRARCSEKLGSLSPMGPWDAYSYAARNAKRSDGSKVGVTRVRVTKDAFGSVTTYVATASGAVSGTIGDLSSDLGAVDEAIQQNAASLVATATTASATPVTVNVTYRLWMYNTSGLTEQQIKDAIAARLVDFMAAQPISGNKVASDPGKLYKDAIATAIGATISQIFHVIVDAPSADVSLTTAQVPVLGTVTATLITQVPPREVPL